MTVPSTARRAGPYTGNGSTTTFSFSFKTFAAGDLLVTRTASSGVETTLVLNSDYSVSLNVDQDASPGGTITYPISGSPLPAGQKLTIVGDLEYEQTTDLLGGGAFNARVIEDTFDRATIQIQQLEERLDRAAVLPVSVSGVSATLPDPEASKVLGWNVTETGLVNIDASSLASVTASAYVVVDKFTGDGSTTQFVCSQLPGSTNAAEVTVAGLMQNPAVDYTVSGARVVFAAPPANGAVIIVRFLVAASQSSGAAFTTERHIATSGQSVFTLANAYAPGADTISVFINGVLMTSVIDYAETSANVVTFVTGLSLNDEVVFHIWRTTVLSTADSANVSYIPAGSGAVQRTVQSKLRDVVSVKDFGAVGDGVTDDTVAIQAAANYVSTIGGTLTFPGGDFKITTRVNFTGAGVLVALSHNTGIVYNTPDYIAFKFTAANCSVVGGLGRGFVGPAAWDGANVSPTYAVLMFEGNNSVAKTRLQNVRKVGIWFKDVLDGTAEECIVEGNYPSGSYTGVETGHIGILFDTSAANSGNFKLVNNTIKSCVQGCMPANYGTGGVTQGFVATGNIFEGCWNHGIYSNFTNGAVITGNNFNRCQIPVVISGNANVISGNTMYVSSDSAGDQRDVAGISVRDGSRNVISGNTIKGTLNASNTVCIDIRDLSGLSQINDNIVSSNTINITAGAGVAIRLRGDTNSVNRNVIESNTITCLGNGAASGAIEINGYASGVNAGNKIVNNSIALTTYGEFFYSTYQTACEVRGNTFEIDWNSGSAVNVYATWWFQPNLCNTQDNVLYCRSGNGSNITFYLYRESGSASDNFLSNNINAVGGSATYAFGVLVSNSGLTVNQLGTGVPNFHAKIGSMWRRSDGGTGSTLYIKESGTDASGWVAK